MKVCAAIHSAVLGMLSHMLQQAAMQGFLLTVPGAVPALTSMCIAGAEQ